MPSEYLAQTVCMSRKTWLETPGINRQLHNDNPTRIFSDIENKFLNRWNLLNEVDSTAMDSLNS